MSFQEIISDAKATAHTVYGLKVGTDKRGHDRVLFFKPKKNSNKQSQREIEKAAKAERIEQYAKEIASGEEIGYRIDENRLYNKQLQFAMAAGLDCEND